MNWSLDLRNGRSNILSYLHKNKVDLLQPNLSRSELPGLTVVSLLWRDIRSI